MTQGRVYAVMLKIQRWMPLILLLTLCIAMFPLAIAQPTTISQVLNVQLIKYGTNLPMPGWATASYSCLNPDGSWYPYSVRTIVNASGGSITIICPSTSIFDPWVHVYGENGSWFGVTAINGIKSLGGNPIYIVVLLYRSYNQRHM